jgi:uncharacterized membrane protein
MSSTDHSTDDRDANAGTAADDEVSWFAESTLRVVLAVVGLVLLLFALGQAAGIDLLGMLADALATRVGRWLAIAFFGLLLVVIAMRGLGTSTD